MPAAFDTRQYRALVRVKLWQAFRAGVDPNTGTKVRPLRQIPISMGFMGLVLCAGAKDLVDFSHLLCAAVTLLIVLVSIPETIAVWEHRQELLGSKPVSRWTMNVADLTVMAVSISFLTLSFSAAPLVVLYWKLGADAVAVLALYLVLNVCAASTAILWLVLSLLVMSRLGVDRVRSFSQLVLVFAGLAIGAFTLAQLGRSADAKIFTDEMMRWIPSSWFAGMVVGPRSTFAAGAMLVLVLVSAYLSVGIDVSGLYARAAGATEPKRREPKVWLLQRLRSLLRFSRQTLALAVLILRVTGRDDMSRIKGIVPNIFVGVVAVGILFYGESSSVALAILLFLALSNLSSGLDVVSQSADAACGWPLWANPVSARRLVHAIRWAVFLHAGLFPMLAVAVVAITTVGARGVWLVVAFPILADVMVCCDLLLQARMPLVGKNVGLGIPVRIVSAFLMMVAGTAAMVLFTLTEFGVFGAAAGVFLLGASVVVSAVASRLAAARLERLELAI